MAQMKAWVYRADLDANEGAMIRLEEVPIPSPGPEDVLVKVYRTSVCGTDLMLFAGRLKKALDGIIPGHEFCGEVVETGPQVTTLETGQMVAAESHYSVEGGAEEGIIGLWPPNLLAGGKGLAYHGGYAEYACIPESCAHQLPRELVEGSFWPSLFEPTGNDFLLAQQIMARITPKHTGVFGCGPHGLYAQAFLKKFGAGNIVAFETDPWRRQFAEEMGFASLVIDPADKGFVEQVQQATSGEAFDVVIDMVGKNGDALDSACGVTRDGGLVVLFGLFTKGVELLGRPANELIFGREEGQFSRHGKTFDFVGITGREGVWPDLIATVAADTALQEDLMKPVHVVGPMDELKSYLDSAGAESLKPAFLPFR